jgi:glucose-1-phosphate thymidylyltransferase
VSRSIVLDNARLELGRARIIDSIIGPNSRIRLTNGISRLIIGEGNVIESM